VVRESFVSKALNKVTDSAGITSTQREEGKKEFAKLSPIDEFLGKLKKRGEKYGLFPWLDNMFYRVAKSAVEFLVNGLYDFKVRGRENIPLNQNVGIILLSQSKTQLDLVFGNAIIQAGAGLESRDATEIVTSDLKMYQAGGFNFAIAQAEVTNLVQLSDNLQRIEVALEKLREQRGLDFTMLMVTDVVGNKRSTDQ
jgi:hypothetical protein